METSTPQPAQAVAVSGNTFQFLSSSSSSDRSMFPPSFTQTAACRRWINIGARHQLYTDEEIACFLMNSYEETQRNSWSLLKGHCVVCGSPLIMACPICAHVGEENSTSQLTVQPHKDLKGKNPTTSGLTENQEQKLNPLWNQLPPPLCPPPHYHPQSHHYTHTHPQPLPDWTPPPPLHVDGMSPLSLQSQQPVTPASWVNPLLCKKQEEESRRKIPVDQSGLLLLQQQQKQPAIPVNRVSPLLSAQKHQAAFPVDRAVPLLSERQQNLTAVSADQASPLSLQQRQNQPSVPISRASPFSSLQHNQPVNPLERVIPSSSEQMSQSGAMLSHSSNLPNSSTQHLSVFPNSDMDDYTQQQAYFSQTPSMPWNSQKEVREEKGEGEEEQMEEEEEGQELLRVSLPLNSGKKKARLQLESQTPLPLHLHHSQEESLQECLSVPLLEPAQATCSEHALLLGLAGAGDIGKDCGRSLLVQTQEEKEEQKEEEEEEKREEEGEIDIQGWPQEKDFLSASLSSTIHSTVTSSVNFGECDSKKKPSHRIPNKKKTSFSSITSRENSSKKKPLRRNLNKEIKMESSKKEFFCQPCNKQLSSRQAFDRHVSSRLHSIALLPPEAQVKRRRRPKPEHPQQANQDKSVYFVVKRGEREEYCCKVCSQAFTSISEVKEHRRQHKSREMCHLCGRTVNVRGFRDHMLRHKGERQHPCSLCSKTFINAALLKAHAVVHSNQKAYCCEICGACFRHSHTLKFHLRVHSGLKVYRCQQCQASFTRPRGLSDHVRVHTGEKPYGCQVCGRCFSSSGNLAAHRRKVHKMAPLMPNVPCRLLMS